MTFGQFLPGLRACGWPALALADLQATRTQLGEATATRCVVMSRGAQPEVFEGQPATVQRALVACAPGLAPVEPGLGGLAMRRPLHVNKHHQRCRGLDGVGVEHAATMQAAGQPRDMLLLRLLELPPFLLMLGAQAARGGSLGTAPARAWRVAVHAPWICLLARRGRCVCSLPWRRGHRAGPWLACRAPRAERA